MITLDPLRDHFAKLVRLIPERAFIIIPEKDGDCPFPSDTKNVGSNPCIEIRGKEYHYVVNDRGHECKREITRDENKINFWISRDYTRWIASRYELRHRMPSQDSRRQWMGLHVQLLERVNPEWAESIRNFYNEILSRHPFSDDGPVRTVESTAYSIIPPDGK
jgi:hypothetical protein